jgi:hypothetical protein
MLTRKNTAKIGIFGKIAAFRTGAGATPGNIDENRPLPYKPRQLSAMTRSDRGGSFWAGNGPLWAGQHHRTYLIVRQIVSSSGKLSAENDP